MKAAIRSTGAVAVLCLIVSPAWAEPNEAPQRKTMTNSLGMKMVWIEPGEFLMGSSDYAAELSGRYGGSESSYADEFPRHWVEISEGFCIGRTEVTRGQFRRFVDDTGYKTIAEHEGEGGGVTKNGDAWDQDISWKSAGFDQTDDHPVVHIAWDDAVAFCRWLSEKEGRRYRLPTEAEWEYACRAGSDSAYCWGNDPNGAKEFANVADATARKWMQENSEKVRVRGAGGWADGHATTSPVAAFKPNAWGLYDMHGNAWEWCGDWYDPRYYSKRYEFDPQGPGTGKSRVRRGGSWFHGPGLCRSSNRAASNAVARLDQYGFRVVMEAESP